MAELVAQRGDGEQGSNGQIKGRTLRLSRSIVFASVFRPSGNVRPRGAMCASLSTYCSIFTFHTFPRPAMAELSASSLAAGQSRIIAAKGEIGSAGPNPLPMPSAA
jgi:hypothetical protein